METAVTDRSRRMYVNLGAAVLLAAVPWTWFLVRDSFGSLTDVLAILLPPVAVLIAVVAVLVGRRWRPALALAVSTLLMVAVAVVGPWLPADPGSVAPGRGITIVGANVDQQGESLSTLVDFGADLVVVVELHGDIHRGLNKIYPHQKVRLIDPETGVFSKYKAVRIEAAGPDLPGERFVVSAPSGPFVLYALHVPRPWFDEPLDERYQVSVAEHHRLIKQVIARLRTETQPVVLVGDLNTVDRGRDYRELLDQGGLVDAMRNGVAAPTSVGKWLPMLGRIDHIMVSKGWCADDTRRVDLPESSHRGNLATVGPCA